MAATSTERAKKTTRLTINVSEAMADQLKDRAEELGITVTELIRRSVSLENLLFAPENQEVVLRDTATNKERVLHVV